MAGTTASRIVRDIKYRSAEYDRARRRNRGGLRLAQFASRFGASRSDLVRGCDVAPPRDGRAGDAGDGSRATHARGLHPQVGYGGPSDLSGRREAVQIAQATSRDAGHDA